jgi:hypothetical protein
VFGGMDQPDGAPPGTPVSVSLQVVEPWSNTQLCPPTAATGIPARPLPFNAMVLVPLTGSLFSKLELSGMKTDPAVPVKMFGDMFASEGGSVVFRNPWFPGGKVVPSEQMAHAKFWVRNVVAIAKAVTRRSRRPVVSVLIFACPYL